MPTYSVEIPGKGTFDVESPTPLTDLQAYRAVQRQLALEAIPSFEAEPLPAKQPEGGFFPAVKRGFLQAGMLGFDILPAMGARLVGADEYAERQLKEAAETQAKIQREVPAAVPSFTDISSLGDAWTYAKEAVGESLASIIPTLLTGGIAGFAARPAIAAANNAAREAAEATLLATAMRAGPPTQAAIEAAKKEAIDAGIKAAQRTAFKYEFAGGFAGSAVQNVPEVYQNILEETGKESIPAALAFGGFNAALDTVLPAKLLAKMRGEGLSPTETMAAWYARGAKGLGKGFLIEGATEAAQETSSIAAENFIAENSDFFNQKNLERVINAGLKGGLGGGVITGAADIALGQAPLPEVTDRQRAEQLQREILGEIDVARAQQLKEEEEAAALAKAEAERPPTVNEIISMASAPTGYEDLESEKQRLLKQTRTEETREAIKTINEIQQRIIIEEQQRRAPSVRVPSIDDLVSLAQMPDGYAQLEVEKQNLLGQRKTPEIKEALDAIKDFQARMVTEQAERQRPPLEPVFDDKTIRSLGFVKSENPKSVYQQLIGKSVADPDAVNFLERYATTAREQTKDRIDRFLKQVERYQIPLTAEEAAQGATDVREAVTAPSGAGIPVVGEPPAVPAARGPGAVEPTRVVPVETDVGQPPRREAAAPAPVAPPAPLPPPPITAPAPIQAAPVAPPVAPIPAPVAAPIPAPIQAAPVPPAPRVEAAPVAPPVAAEAPAVAAPVAAPEAPSAPPVATPDIDAQIASLKADQNKLLTSTNKVPAPRSKARKQFDALQQQIDALEAQKTTAPETITEKTVAATKPRKVPTTVMGSPLLALVNTRLRGLSPSLLSEFSHRVPTNRIGKDGKQIQQWRNPLIPGFGTLFRSGGTSDYVEIAQMLEEAGYLEPGSVEADYKGAGERAKDLIKEALYKGEVLTLDEQIEQQRKRQEEMDQEEQRLMDEAKAAQAQGQYPQVDAESAAQAEADKQPLLAEAKVDQPSIDTLTDDEMPFDVDVMEDVDIDTWMRERGFADADIQEVINGRREAAVAETTAEVEPEEVEAAAPVREAAPGPVDLDAAVDAEPSETKADQVDIAVVGDALYNSDLTEEETTSLETAYKSQVGSAEFIRRLTQDVQKYITDGAKAVAAGIRSAVKKIAQAVLSIAVVFNANVAFPDAQLYAKAQPSALEVPDPGYKKQDLFNANGRTLSPNAARVANWIASQNKQDVSLILDPFDGKMYVMKGREIVADAPALYGKAGVGEINDTILTTTMDKMTPDQKITPAGVFRARLEKDAQYGTAITFMDAYTGSYAIHRAYLGNPSERRADRLKNSDPADNNISYGCVNVSNEFYDNVLSKLDFSGEAYAYMLPSNIAQLKKFFPKASLAQAPKAPKPLKLSKETEAKIEELGKIMQRIMGKFGLKDVALNIERDLKNNGEYANRLIKLALDADSPVRDLRHESLHAMKELGFFSDAQWKTLEKMARDKWVDKYLKNAPSTYNGETMSRYDAYMRLYNGNEETILEEAIADAFSDFDITKPPPGLMQALLRRMRDLFRGIKEAMGLANIDSAEDIFRRVEKGELKETAAAPAGAPKPSLRAPETEAFKKWFGDSKIVNPDGTPKVMYHGTARDITEFRPKQAGAIFVAPEPRFAEGFAYSSEEWMQRNYRDVLTEKQIADARQKAIRAVRETYGDGRINRSAVQKLIADIEGGNPKGEARDYFMTAVAESIESGPNIVPVYVRAENPFDYENPKHVADAINVSIERGDVEKGDRESLVEDIASGSWDFIEEGYFQRAIRALGHDGFYIKEGGVKNLAVYKPEQLKSATGNIGTFDITKPDIRASLRAKPFNPASLPKTNRPYTLPQNTILYHGAYRSIADAIQASGYLMSRPGTKSSGGTPYEGGLVWFGDQEVAQQFADSKADPFKVRSDEEAGIVREPGKVFEAITDKPYSLISYSHKFSAEEATKVNEALGLPDYKQVRKGDSASIAALRASDYRNSKAPRYIVKSAKFEQEISAPWPLIAEALNADGIYFDNTVALTAQNGIRLGEPGKPMERFSLRSGIPLATRQRIDQTTTSRKEEGFVERILDAISPQSFSTFRTQFINRYNQLSVYDKKLAQQMGGVKLLADTSAEAAALFSDLGAGLTASALGVHDRAGGIPVYRNGVTIISNQNGTVKGPVAIFAPLAKYGDPFAYQSYQFWSGVKRGSRFMADGREQLFEPADVQKAEALRKQFLQDGVDFEAIQKEWIKFNDGLVDYMVATGVLSSERAAIYKQHSDYLPFYRQMNGEDTVGPKVFQAISGVKPPKKLKGGEAPLDDFLENIVRNVQSGIQAGVKNVAAQRAADVAVKINMANKLNYQSSGPNIFHVYENGRQVSYASQDMLFINAVKSLGLPDIPFIGMLSGPSNLLRNLVTKDPAFMLANLMRDSMAAWVTSGTKMTPLVDTMRNFGAALSGKSPEFQDLLNAGIIGGYEFSQNVEQSGRELDKALRKQAGTKAPGMKGVLEMGAKPVTSLWEALEKGTTASDAATRIEIYKRTLAETGNEAEALYRSLEVMNFNRKGSSAIIRILTAAVPFLNARIQGLDVLYRAASGQMNRADAKEVQRQFFVRGATIAAISAAYWALTHDDEEYKKQEQETRDNYWLLPSLGVKIPIPFEIGVLFKVIPERILAYTMGTDTGEDFLKSMARQLTSTLAFNPIPQAVLPVVESMTNFSFFTMRPIVGQGLDGVQAAYQVGPGTSRLAEFLGDATKGLAKELQISPMKLDQLISGYTGTMGMYLVNLMDAIYDMNTDSPKPSRRFEQMPFIRRFAVDPEARGSVTAYYDLKNSVDAIVRTSNMLERTMNYEELPGYLQDNAMMLASKDYILDLEKTMKEFREMKIMIRSATMTADAKRDAVSSIEKMENQLTANIQYLKSLAKSGS